MKLLLTCAALAVAVCLASPHASSQVPAPDPVQASPKKAAVSKDAPKKTAAPKKDVATKEATAKKPAPKVMPPKDTTPSKTAVSKNVTIYKNTPPPPLKGKDGKDIPTSPDAYDVSSAVPRKK